MKLWNIEQLQHWRRSFDPLRCAGSLFLLLTSSTHLPFPCNLANVSSLYVDQIRYNCDGRAASTSSAGSTFQIPTTCCNKKTFFLFSLYVFLLFVSLLCLLVIDNSNKGNNLRLFTLSSHFSLFYRLWSNHPLPFTLKIVSSFLKQQTICWNNSTARATGERNRQHFGSKLCISWSLHIPA